MLNGWKAIAAYLGREERTAMRWAGERGLPVHRAPGRGRGSVYAIVEEIDAWLATDRSRAAVTPSVGLTEAITHQAAPHRHRHARAALLIAVGALIAGVGALTLHRPVEDAPHAQPVFTDAATKAMFLQATYDWNLRTSDSLRRAREEYGEVIARDPRVPAAYVGLANTFLLLREFGSMPDADAYPRAEAAARAAAALAPGSPDAHRALAFIAFWGRQDRADARREFARALALGPNDPLTHHWFATALSANGEAVAALSEINNARDLDPTGTAILADRGQILYVAGEREEGLATLRALSLEQPDAVGPHRALAEIALARGNVSAFLEESATAARLRGDTAALADLARWRSAGPNPEAIETAMLRDAQRNPAGAFRRARLAALLGRANEAKAALASACMAHEPATISAPSDLWLSRALAPSDVVQRCGRTSLQS